MNELKYKITQLYGEILEGQAEKILIQDEKNVLTILKNFAPLVAMLKMGKITIFHSENEKKEYKYQEGFLDITDNLCSVVLLG